MKNKLITISLLSLGIFFLMVTPALTKGINSSIENHFSSPIIRWTPEKFSEKIFIGGSIIRGISFISKEDLVEISVFIVPELKPFISVKPEHFTSVKAGEENELELKISIPQDISLGIVEGTVHLKALKQKGKKNETSRTLARPLAITLEIIEPTDVAVDSLNDFLIEEFGTLTPSIEEISEITEFPEEIVNILAEETDEVAVMKAGSLVFSGFMTPNAEAKSAMFDLLYLLKDRGVLVDDLHSTLNNHDLHKEGTESGGALITVNTKATTVFPIHPLIPFTAYDQNNNGWADTFIIFLDNDTHSIHKPSDIEELIAKNFIQDNGRLTESASTAIHELIHAVIFRTSCFGGSISEEENFVTRVESLINLKISDSPLFTPLLKEAIQIFPQGKDCLDRLGFIVPPPLPPDSIELISIAPSCGATLQHGTSVDFEVTVAYNLDSVESGIVDAQLNGGTTGVWVIIEEVEVKQGLGTAVIRGSFDVDWLYQVLQDNTLHLILWLGHRIYYEDYTVYITLMRKPMPECSYHIIP